MAMKRVPVRAYLAHLTHYDPMWLRRKPREQPFNLDLALEIVDALAAEKFTHLVIDCADAVRYRSHPELARKYTVPMSALERLSRAARSAGLDVIPKLNFARSQWHHHNDWMLAPGEKWHEHFDDDAYWAKASDLIGELVAACGPKRYFHVGIDEDHDRAYSQFTDAIKSLRTILRAHKLRTVIWNDSASAITYRGGLIHVEKSLAAEKSVPKDVVHVLWQYSRAPVSDIKRIVGAGLPLWGAPGRLDPAATIAFRDAVVRAGGKGLLMSTWMPLRAGNRKTLLSDIRAMGPIYRGEA